MHGTTDLKCLQVFDMLTLVFFILYKDTALHYDVRVFIASEPVGGFNAASYAYYYIKYFLIF